MSMNYFNPFFSVKVMDGLFICNQTAVKDQQFIMNNKFSLIVNTCPRQFKVLPVQNVYKVTNFHWVNSKNQLIQAININMFKPIFQQITSNLQEGHGTLIVSERGHSRSITFVILYLMDKFGWQLFKSLEYINSKRQNLSVRATYLKLLVGYEKVIKGQSLENSKIIQNEDIPNHIKPSKEQKWSQQNIECQHQKLITNTFKNTIKKRHINQINLQYRERVNNSDDVTHNERRSLSVVNSSVNSRDKHKDKDNENINRNNNNNNNNQRRRNKSVQFSNEIEIIIGESQMVHNFPQYELLKSSSQVENNKKAQHNNNNNNNNNNNRALISSSNRQQRPVHSPNRQLINNNRSITRKEQTQRQQQSLSRKQLFTNSRLINIRRMQQQKNVKQQQLQKQQQSSYQKDNHHHNVIQLHNNDIYDDNQFYEEGQQQQQYNVDRTIGKQKSISTSNQLFLDHNNQYLPLESFIKSVSKQRKNNSLNKHVISHKGGHSEKVTNQKYNEYNNNVNKKTRLSSYKKLKASILENQFKFNHHSPLKKEHKQQRTQTQPKYDLQIDNVSSKFKKPVDRRLSSTQTQSMRAKFGNELSHQRKSLSSVLGMKTMGKIDKINSSYGKQKRCQTPQLAVSQSLLINNHSISNHNNIIGRPLSRGKSNSVRMTKKSTQSCDSQVKHSHQPHPHQPQHPTNIFNVNINVNIGKLQMFNNMNNNSQQSSTKNVINKRQKLFKNLSQIDKISLINSRPRSNSSNQNYSKYHVSNNINVDDNSNNNNSNKQTAWSNKFLHHHNLHNQMGKNCIQKQSFNNKNFVNKNLSTFHNSSGFSMDQLNIGSCESFTKQQIINKINKKLIHNNKSQHQYQQQLSSKNNHNIIKQNNFM